MSLGELLSNRYVWLDGLAWTLSAGASWAYLQQSTRICEMIEAHSPGMLEAMGGGGYTTWRPKIFGLTGLLVWNDMSDFAPTLDTADFRSLLNRARLSAVVLVVSLVVALVLLAWIDVCVGIVTEQLDSYYRDFRGLARASSVALSFFGATAL